jgi:hypothetical protein
VQKQLAAVRSAASRTDSTEAIALTLVAAP